LLAKVLNGKEERKYEETPARSVDGLGFGVNG